MRLLILPSARDDLDSGYSFYERQEKGLGDYFFESLFSDIEALKSFPGTHQRVFGYHRKLAQRFPYAIYYSVADDIIRVVAVLDCRRDPQRIRGRIESLS